MVFGTFGIIKHPILETVCVHMCLGSFVNTSSGEGIVALYAAPNPFLLNKIRLNQWCVSTTNSRFQRMGSNSTL